MTKKIPLGLLAVLALGTGIFLVSPGQKTTKGEAKTPAKSLSAKSARSFASPRVSRPPARAMDSPGALANERTLRLSSASFSVFGRTFLLPAPSAEASVSREAARMERPARGRDDVVRSRDSHAASLPSLAAQVIAHRQDRKEFMRRRYAELASHTPGCKCPHHAGNK